MYYKKVNKNKKDEMIEFLSSHFRYDTANPWNGTTSYANKIKYYDLELPEDVSEKFWDFYEHEYAMSDFWYDVVPYIEEFENNYPYSVSVNGKNDGYLVLHQKEDEQIYPYRNIGSDDPEFYSEWSRDELKQEVEMVQAFDKLCDTLREQFIQHLRDFNPEADD